MWMEAKGQGWIPAEYEKKDEDIRAQACGLLEAGVGRVQAALHTVGGHDLDLVRVVGRMIGAWRRWKMWRTWADCWRFRH